MTSCGQTQGGPRLGRLRGGDRLVLDGGLESCPLRVGWGQKPGLGLGRQDHLCPGRAGQDPAVTSTLWGPKPSGPLCPRASRWVWPDLQGPQELGATLDACDVEEQVDGPRRDLGPVLCVGLDGVQHLLLILVTAHLETRRAQINTETHVRAHAGLSPVPGPPFLPPPPCPPLTL